MDIRTAAIATMAITLLALAVAMIVMNVAALYGWQSHKVHRRDAIIGAAVGVIIAGLCIWELMN